ncbi:RNA-binding protein MEX3B [Syngnathus acus]|uniref:RNA-binding protein MEX3B n=1 Tax=Syngnathus acus TaxID=161584 RepID=UPI0018864B75|nr:RNA-binding protein MEX3B [Syngnathus acus]XP_037132987.1 RNA-binding protein MEX3B [Syngnathus acus]
MPSPLFHPDIMDHDVVISSQHNGVGLPRETDQESRDEDHQEVLRFALDQLSLMALEKVDCGGGGGGGGGLVDTLDGTQAPGSEGYVDLQMSRDSPTSCSPSPEYYGSGGYHMAGGSHPMLHGEQSASVLCNRKRSVNMTECVPVPSSEHVAEIVGRQGCKIKALRAKTNTYIKTPVRGEEPVFIVTGRREDVEMAKREIVSAAEHFSMIRASRCKAGGSGGGGGGGGGGSLPGPPHLPGQTTIQVRVPYRVVGLVVGPKGATIKRIQQQTHTYIVTPSREKDPVFEVTGMPENVDRAREEIETHITLRTGTFVDLQGDNDFHTNGTDVSLEGLGALSAGLGASLWSRASNHHSAPPPPAPSPPPAAIQMSVNRKMSSSVAYHAHNGAMSSDGYGGGRKGNEGASPTSPFSTGSSSAGGGFAFGGDSTPLPSSEELGFEFSASNIWAPFVNGANKSGGPSHPQPPLRRNSSGLSGGAITPRLSPTLPQDVVASPLEHPLARRAQSDPLSTLSWLQSGSAPGGSGGSFSGGSSSSSGGSSTGYSSCSASSLPGGSPTDSEGGAGLSSGMLSRLKGGPGPGVAGLVGAGPGVNRDCFVCFESEVTAALVPCGHNLFCMECAGQICQSSEPECPVCHTPTTQCIRIFS